MISKSGFPVDIAIDFDGTCVRHEYPATGGDIGAVPVLRKIVASGHHLILYTMRSGLELEHAKQWFLDNNIKLYGIQYNPNQALWTCSNKCYAQLYIDDAALGAPLIYPEDKTRPYINWNIVETILIEKGII